MQFSVTSRAGSLEVERSFTEAGTFDDIINACFLQSRFTKDLQCGIEDLVLAVFAQFAMACHPLHLTN